MRSRLWAARPEATARLAGGTGLLHVHDLQVRYGSISAVRGVSLDVARGEVVVLLGVNGAGKTTVLSGIIGLTPVSGGTIVFDGEDITRSSPEAAVGRGLTLCPEGRRIFAGLSVRENLRLAAGFVSRRLFRERLEEVLDLFPILGERLVAMGGELSGGQQQQLAIARALMRRPRLLLLDEPSLGLAPKIAASVFELIATLAESGITILMVEQNAERALDLADRAYVLQSGRVVLEGTPEALRRADIEAAYLGLPTAGPKEPAEK